MPTTGSYVPQSGVGGAVLFGNVPLAADEWAWGGAAKVMDAPSFTGAQWMEYCVGKKRLALSFAGTYNAAFNPFAVGIKLGLSGVVIFRINSAVIATCPDAIVETWDVTNLADGKCDYVCRLIGNFIFGDFSGGNA